MKPYGLPKRKKLGPCGPHDLFECFCDNRHKSKERADAKLEIKKLRIEDDRVSKDSQ